MSSETHQNPLEYFIKDFKTTEKVRETASKFFYAQQHNNTRRIIVHGLNNGKTKVPRARTVDKYKLKYDPVEKKWY